MIFPPGTLPLIDGDRAYVVLPAEVVCGGSVMEYEWSPNGQRVAALVERYVNGKTVRLIVTGGVGLAPKGMPADADDRILAVGNDGTVIVKGVDAKKIPVVDALISGVRRTLLTLDDPKDAIDDAFVRPTDGGVFLAGSDWVGEIRASRLRKMKIPANTFLGFAAPGSYLVYRRPKYASVDLATGKEKEIYVDDVVEPGTSKTFRVKGGNGRDVTLLFSNQTQKESVGAMICREGDDVKVLVDDSKVSFVVAGALVYRPIVAVAPEFARGLEAEYAQAETTRVAREAALGLIICAADFDDVLPGGDWRDTAAPYVKNKSTFERFVRTYEGRDLTGVKDRANTPLGFVSGSGGRAIAYLDGSVRWEPIKR